MTEPKTPLERLEELLAMKDEKIAAIEAELQEAREENRTLEYKIDGSIGGWSLPRTIKDEHPELPVPRLELLWVLGPERDGMYYSFEIEYRLVRRHLTDHLEVTPLSRTRCTGSSRPKPWACEAGIDLPFRDGAHIAHDSTHLGFPAYAITPEGATALDLNRTHPSQMIKGKVHRKTL